jgi:hypothetical protein
LRITFVIGDAADVIYGFVPLACGCWRCGGKPRAGNGGGVRVQRTESAVMERLWTTCGAA